MGISPKIIKQDVLMETFCNSQVPYVYDIGLFTVWNYLLMHITSSTVEALYRNTHPEYLQYIYLVAPISLMVLNPIGFAFCEVQKWRHEQQQHQSKMHVVRVVLIHVLKNPIVFMVVIGIGAHFVLGPKIPDFMQEFVDGLANSFGGAALFYLGLTMVGQLKKLTRSTVVALILLITAKL